MPHNIQENSEPVSLSALPNSVRKELGQEMSDSEPVSFSALPNLVRDELGQEMSEGATIWQEYARAANAHDEQLLRQWNQNLDTMLIVATLFSAVVTAFVIETFQDLGPSAQDLTNGLLLDVVQAIKNPQLNNSQANVEPPEFVPSSNNVWINGLWFTSLACSLGDAAIAMLIKQWLNAYSFGLPASPQLRSRMRQHRFNALIRWKTPEIIGFLPFALSDCVTLHGKLQFHHWFIKAYSLYVNYSIAQGYIIS
ncbi:hypothetical protein B0H11DRAFT_2192939 [Mycena galericulata]|nr:hypothetical protein B0H11DRAFT_2196751 [Mycena galericulata]KAJ7483950.1 hypothetical protein B0H11DRAFT_2192939 [Mycena galericulata]